MTETDEKVLCVTREYVETVLPLMFYTPEYKLKMLLANQTYRNRHTPNGNDPDVEHDDRYKQLIPGVVVVNSKDQILTYNRGWKGGEDRLKGKWTCLFGGHVNDEDADWLDGLRREVDEELSGVGYMLFGDDSVGDEFPPNSRLHGPIGFINDDSDDVGRHHLGVVYILRADEVVPRENPEFEWIRPEMTKDSDVNFENWARLALPMVRAWLESEGE